MSQLEYREIIEEQIRLVVKKRDNATDERQQQYWNWIISQLIADYRDYERRQRWRRVDTFDWESLLDKWFREFFDEDIL